MEKKPVVAGYDWGCIFAFTISYHYNESFPLALIHAFLSWFYVIYSMFK